MKKIWAKGGAAIKTALNAVIGELAIIQDGDLEYDPTDYVKLIEVAQKENVEIIYGSRFLKT